MPAQPINTGYQEVLGVGAVKGVDGTTAPYLLDPSNLVDMTNFLPDQGYAALTTALGRGNIPGIGALTLPGPCRGFALFNRYNPFTATPPVYIFAIDVGANGTLWAIRTDGVGGLMQLTKADGVTPITLTPGQQTFFAEAGVWLFMSNGTDTPLKIDNSLNVTNWGIQPPMTAPTLSGALISGHLSYGEAPYYYCITFGHAKTSFLDPGQESSQGTIAGPYKLQQTPGTGSIVVDPAVSGLAGGYNFQFTIELAGAPTPYGAEYTTINGETAEHLAHGVAAMINQAPPIAYTHMGDTGILIVTATVSGGTINISVADSVGTAIGDPGYVQYYLDYLHAAPGGPYYCDPNQSDPASISGGFTETAIDLTNIPTSTDPQVTERNIYRLGGALGQWRLVNTLNDNTETIYTDRTADTDLTGQALVVSRDAPPPFAYICAHQQRIFGFNTLQGPSGSGTARNNASSLWWSNYAEPWGFNELNNILTVGESLEGDPGIGMASLGNVLGICKRKGFYALYGNSDATFGTGLYKVADTGCASATSICAAYGAMGWASRQGAYVWTGMTLPQNISDGAAGMSNIKNVFDQAALKDLGNVVGFWYGRMLGFSFNAPTQRTYMYDQRSQGWYPLPYFLTQVSYDITSDVPVVGFRGAGDFGVDAWFLYGTDLGQDLIATGLTRTSADPGMEWAKNLTHLLVDAPVGSATFEAVVVTDPGSVETAWPLPQPFDLSQGYPRHRAETQQIEFVDVQLSFTLTTSQPATRINRIALYATPIRELAPETQSDQ